MPLAWRRFFLLVGLGSPVLFSASCELVLGIHDPPKTVDSSDALAILDTQGGDDAGGASGTRDTQAIADGSGGAVETRDTQRIGDDASGAAAHDAQGSGEVGDEREPTLPADAGALAVTRADASPQPDLLTSLDDGLVVHYKFDDPPSKTAIDSACWNGTPRNASLVTVADGTATFSGDRQVGTGSLELTADNASSSAYATTLSSPGLRDLAPSALTMATWVLMGGADNRAWQRVFDFGASSATATPSIYLFLTTSHPDSGAGNVRFTISRDGYSGEQVIDGTRLSPFSWHHLAVVLPEGAPYTGRLYVDGVLRGVNPNMTLHATDLGATDQNFIGRSQFSVDPTFVGRIDDFRIYARALSEEEIGRLVKVR